MGDVVVWGWARVRVGIAVGGRVRGVVSARLRVAVRVIALAVAAFAAAAFWAAAAASDASLSRFAISIGAVSFPEFARRMKVLCPPATRILAHASSSTASLHKAWAAFSRSRPVPASAREIRESIPAARAT